MPVIIGFIENTFIKTWNYYIFTIFKIFENQFLRFFLWNTFMFICEEIKNNAKYYIIENIENFLFNNRFNSIVYDFFS